jgi:CRP-like cAMP-binding protein
MRRPAACRRIQLRDLKAHTLAETPANQPAQPEPDRIKAIAQQASDYQVAIERQLQRLTASDRHRRLAQALLALAELDGTPSDEAPPVWIRITHRDLAYVAILPINATDRILEEFAHTGLITPSQGRIRLDDPQGLHKVANREDRAITAPVALPRPYLS